jgi:hypothetical protein
MIIKDLNGRDYKIPNLIEFKNHIMKYHTSKSKPDGSIHEENGYYFRVDINLFNKLFD